MVVDTGAADFVEAEGCVEGVGGGIGRVEVNLADDTGVAGGSGTLEKFGVEGAGITPAAGGASGDDAVHVDEIGIVEVSAGCSSHHRLPGEVGAKPEKVRAIVIGGLVEGEKQRVGFSDGGCVEGLLDEVLEAVEGQG